MRCKYNVKLDLSLIRETYHLWPAMKCWWSEIIIIIYRPILLAAEHRPLCLCQSSRSIVLICKWFSTNGEWRPRTRSHSVGRPLSRWTEALVRDTGRWWMRNTQDRLLWWHLRERLAVDRLSVDIMQLFFILFRDWFLRKVHIPTLFLLVHIRFHSTAIVS